MNAPAPPCPAWCTEEQGHPFESILDLDETPSRIHSTRLPYGVGAVVQAEEYADRPGQLVDTVIQLPSEDFEADRLEDFIGALTYVREWLENNGLR